MNPLEYILKWFNSTDKEIQTEFASLACHLHLDSSLELKDSAVQIKSIVEYLESNKLDDKATMQRVFFLKGLIGFTIVGRDTEESWEETRSSNERIQNKAIAEGRRLSFYADFIKNYDDRKTKWISWANEWKLLCNTVLSDQELSKWYMERIMKDIDIRPPFHFTSTVK